MATVPGSVFATKKKLNRLLSEYKHAMTAVATQTFKVAVFLKDSINVFGLPSADLLSSRR